MYQKENLVSFLLVHFLAYFKMTKFGSLISLIYTKISVYMWVT